MLKQIVWESLNGEHRNLAVGGPEALRYVRGGSPIAGFANPDNPKFEQLAPFCEPGEPLYTDAWSGPEPDGWTIEREGTMFKMILSGSVTTIPVSSEIQKLTSDNAEAALELAELTHPGPFGLRTLDLGDYFGIFEGDRLISMAGERFWRPPYREISGVCTHPDFQGRGLAKILVNHLVQGQVARGEIPFLHVMTDNELARGMYRRLGFEDHLESVVRVFSRKG